MWGKQAIHIVSKAIILKVNVSVWLEFELAYFRATDQHFNYYVTKEFRKKALLRRCADSCSIKWIWAGTDEVGKELGV